MADILARVAALLPEVAAARGALSSAGGSRQQVQVIGQQQQVLARQADEIRAEIKRRDIDIADRTLTAALAHDRSQSGEIRVYDLQARVLRVARAACRDRNGIAIEREHTARRSDGLQQTFSVSPASKSPVDIKPTRNRCQHVEHFLDEHRHVLLADHNDNDCNSVGSSVAFSSLFNQ